MDLQSFDFNFRLLDIVDILLVAVILYYVYSLIRGTIAVNILIGLGLIYVIYLLVTQFNMHLLTEIFGGFISVGSLALVVVFQQEIRRFLIPIGKNISVRRKILLWSVFLRHKTAEHEPHTNLKPNK